jgi:predicted DNA-binding protein (UPF0251 family)
MLSDALRKLPVESLQAIQLCQFAENPLKDAASTLGLPLTTLKTRLHRARRAVAVHIKRKAQAKRVPVRQSAQYSMTSAECTLCPREVGALSPLTTEDRVAPAPIAPRTSVATDRQ